MTIGDVFADIFLGLAAALVMASSVGILVMRDVYQKLHYVTPVALVSPILVGIAVLIKEGNYEDGMETWLALFLIAISSPLVTHAIIRAAHIRENGDWRPASEGRPLEAGDGEK